MNLYDHMSLELSIVINDTAFISFLIYENSLSG